MKVRGWRASTVKPYAVEAVNAPDALDGSAADAYCVRPQDGRAMGVLVGRLAWVGVTIRSAICDPRDAQRTRLFASNRRGPAVLV
jgi:hypothetical protein